VLALGREVGKEHRYAPRRKKERNAGLAGHSSRKHSLSRSRFTSEQHTLWELPTELGESCRVLQERDHVFKLFFGLIDTMHITEANRLARLVRLEFRLTGSCLDEPRVLDHDG
jgi:hypothetical protein